MKAAALTLAQARASLRFCDSYTRLPAVLDLAPRMADHDWLRLLGAEWSGFDNIGVHLPELLPLLPAGGPVMPMMTKAEAARHAALPELVTVYRGCGPENQNGLCWSLDGATAERFPFTHRYRAAVPLLLTGQAQKADVLAIKLDRNEAEVIASRVSVLSVTALAAAMAQEVAA